MSIYYFEKCTKESRLEEMIKRSDLVYGCGVSKCKLVILHLPSENLHGCFFLCMNILIFGVKRASQ